MQWVSLAMITCLSIPVYATPTPRRPEARRAPVKREATTPRTQPTPKATGTQPSARDAAAPRKATPRAAAKRPAASRGTAASRKAPAKAKAADAKAADAKAPAPRSEARAKAPAPPAKARAKAAPPAKARAKEPAPRPTPAARRPVERRKPDSRSATRPDPARRAAPSTRAADAKAPSSRKKPSVPRKPAKPRPLPYTPDRSVQRIQLKNGLVGWCKSNAAWKLTQLRVAIAAGTATDPKNLHGIARFLSELLRSRLNQPKNPPHSQIPKGGSFYKIDLGKDWLVIRARLHPSNLQESLEHIGASLRMSPPDPLPAHQRKALIQSTGRFPPPALLERIERHLFYKQPRGALIRGQRKAFKTLRSLRLQMSHQALYRGYRTRVLVVGPNGCSEVDKHLRAYFSKLAGPKKDKPLPLFTKGHLRPSGRLFLSQELLHLLQLPNLTRSDYFPLLVIQSIARREVDRTLRLKYGNGLPLKTALQPFVEHGYMLFVLPSHARRRTTLHKLLKSALGNLRMTPYQPNLKQRLRTYTKTLELHFKEQQESSQGTIGLLLPQLLLPSKDHLYPHAVTPFLRQLKTPTIRDMARRFMGQSMPLSSSTRPFSLERVILFIGTLLLVWILLDQTFRRSRKNED